MNRVWLVHNGNDDEDKVNLLETHYVSVAVLITSHLLCHLVLIITLYDEKSYGAHFIGEGFKM